MIIPDGIINVCTTVHLPWRLQDIDQAVDKLVAGRPYPLVRTEVEAQLAKMYPVPAPVHEDRGFILLDQDDMIAALHIPGAISPALLATAHAAFEDLAGAGLLKDGDDCHPCGTGLLTVGFGNSPTIDCVSSDPKSPPGYGLTTSSEPAPDRPPNRRSRPVRQGDRTDIRPQHCRPIHAS